jgi:hypothetical protein
MKAEGVDYKYDINDSFILRIEELMCTEDGEPAYRTNVGDILEEDLEGLELISKGAGNNNVLLIEVRQNDPDYRNVIYFDNWLEAYKAMIRLVTDDSDSDELEEAMKTGIVRIAQYSASVVRGDGRFFFYIIKLSNREVNG